MGTEKRMTLSTAATLIITVLAGASLAVAAEELSVVSRRNRGGPRFGVTAVPGDNIVPAGGH